MRLKIPIKEIPQRLGRIYIFQVVLIFHHQNFDFPPSVPAEKRSQIKSAEGEKRKKKYVCFLVIVEVRVSHLSYAFLVIVMYAPTLLCFRKIFTWRGQGDFFERKIIPKEVHLTHTRNGNFSALKLY